MDILLGIGGLVLALILCILLGFTYKRIGVLEKQRDYQAGELEKLQAAFHRFTPRYIVDKIIDQGIFTHGEKKDVTVLFADIVGFTTLSERLDSEVLVRILNGYFETMSAALNSHRGYVSKFIGDGIMALFGVPEPNPWQSLDAVMAALTMKKALAEYNLTLTQQQLPALSIGIGIHRGTVVAGVLGSAERMEYTVIGDVVNTASRLEAFTREIGVDILVSHEVRSCLDKRFIVEELPPIELKGKSNKISPYIIKGIYIHPGSRSK